jgi:hypothetical protein
MSAPDPIMTWRQLLDQKARHLHEQIAGTYNWVQQNANGDPQILENMTSDLYGWLRELYEHELPLVKILDEADLSLEFSGPATRVEHPKASLVRKCLEKAQKQVTTVTRSIAGISSADPDRKRFYSRPEFELGFASLSFNSALRIGLTLPEMDEDNVLAEEEPVYKAMNKAVQSIQVVSACVAQGKSEDEIQSSASEQIGDPRLLDMAMFAVKNMTPSNSKEIDSVRMGGGENKAEEAKPLTLESRKWLNEILKSPVKSREEIEITGTIREIDLDGHRFELRNIQDDTLVVVRCIYQKKYADSVVRHWLDQTVEVKGRVERDANGQPRLIRLKEINVPGADDRQNTFEFPDED